MSKGATQQFSPYQSFETTNPHTSFISVTDNGFEDKVLQQSASDSQIVKFLGFFMRCGGKLQKNEGEMANKNILLLIRVFRVYKNSQLSS